MAGSVKQAVAHAVFRAFRGCLALGLYEGAGVCLALLTKKHNSGGDGVLCLSRSVFADDVLALAENGGSLTYYSFPKNLLRDFVRRFFPAGVVEATYHLPEYAECRERLYRAVRRMMRAFLVLRPCRCVLSGNFGYLEQQELFRFFRDSGRLGAVLFKEGIALQNMQAPSSLARVFAGKRFLADLALFYNEEIAAMMAGAGVPGLEPSKCRPVGVPRMDRYHGRKSLPDKSLVLFSFYPEDKFKYFVSDAGVRQGLDGRAAEFHRAVVAFAVDHPEWSVVVKTKKSPHYLDYVRDLARAETGGSLPANLTITADAPPA